METPGSSFGLCSTGRWRGSQRLRSCTPFLHLYHHLRSFHSLMSSIDTSFSISPHDLYPAFPIIPERPARRKICSSVRSHVHLRYSPYARPQLRLTYIVRCPILVLVPLSSLLQTKDAAYVEGLVEIVMPHVCHQFTLLRITVADVQVQEPPARALSAVLGPPPPEIQIFVHANDVFGGRFFHGFLDLVTVSKTFLEAEIPTTVSSVGIC